MTILTRFFLVCTLCTVASLGAARSVSGAILFSDNFNRSSNHVVGNGWTEIEHDAYDVAVSSNYLRLRDEQRDIPDAAVTQGISTAGYENIFVDFDWGRSETEDADTLNLSWDLGDSKWTTVWTQKLGGRDGGFASVSIDMLPTVDDQAKLRLRLWTNVSDSDEYAKVDNFVVRGDVIQNNSPANNPVPEPAAMLVWSVLGLTFAGGLRWAKKRG